MIKKANKKDKHIIDLSDALKNQEHVVEILSEETKTHTENSLKIIQESFNQMLEIIDNSQRIFQESVLKNLELPNYNFKIKEAFEKFGKYFEKYGEILDIFSLLMTKIDWPPPMDFNSQHMSVIIKFYNEHSLEETEREVSNFLIKSYDSKKIEEMVNSWIKKDWIEKRKSIIQAAVDAHISGHYLLSVPTMLTQIEGIIVDGYGHVGWLGQEKLEKYIKELLPESNTFSPDSVIRNILINTILAKFEHGKKINSSLSRHAILHGADTDYGSEKNSLKSLLLFNYLQKSFKLVNIKTSRIYHKIGCPRIIRSEKYKKTYRSEHKAKDDGKIPCRICIRDENL